MNTQKTESWTWIGFRFGIGFALGSAVIAGLCGAVFWFAAAYSIRLAVPTVPVFHETHRVQVPGRNREECLAESGGIANEQFARCRSGYSFDQAD